MRLLVLAPDAPFPPITGGQRRIHCLLAALAARHEITLVGFNWGLPSAAPPFPIRVVEVAWEMPRLHEEMTQGEEDVARTAFLKLATETDEPFLVSYFDSLAMEQTLRDVAREPFDWIIFENTFMARFLPALPPEVPKVLVMHNVLSLIAQRQAEGALGDDRIRADFERTLDFEKTAATRCDLCIVVSEQEAAAARTLLGVDRLEVVPNGVDTTFFTPTEGPTLPGYLLFTGSMNYWPNIEAVQYFAKDILPRIRQRFSEATFHIVGTSPGKEVRQLASDSITVHGTVPDMRPYYREAALVVVPLLHGGGTRLKILEAGASGKAIVSTSVGAEGLEFRSGESLVVADSVDEMVDSIIDLCSDSGRCSRLGQNARQASLPYDWLVIGSQLCRIIESLH
jgi:glycosyltransferase involved in cell wall biosynthesis